MIDPSLAQTSAPSTEYEAAHERLLDAAREAQAWFRRFERHVPQEAHMGDEENIRRRLGEAIRLASFEVRPCAGCDGGVVPDPSVGPTECPEMVACASCDGAGSIKVFAYGRVGASRRRR